MYNHHSSLQAIQKLTSSTQAKTELFLRIQTRHFNFHKRLTFTLFCQATNMICFYLASVSSTYNKSRFCLATSLNKASLVQKKPPPLWRRFPLNEQGPCSRVCRPDNCLGPHSGSSPRQMATPLKFFNGCLLDTATTCDDTLHSPQKVSPCFFKYNAVSSILFPQKRKKKMSIFVLYVCKSSLLEIVMIYWGPQRP